MCVLDKKGDWALEDSTYIKKSKDDDSQLLKKLNSMYLYTQQ